MDAYSRELPGRLGPLERQRLMSHLLSRADRKMHAVSGHTHTHASYTDGHNHGHDHDHSHGQSKHI